MPRLLALLLGASVAFVCGRVASTVGGDNGTRVSYASLSHCHPPPAAADALEAWLDAVMARECDAATFRRAQPRGNACGSAGPSRARRRSSSLASLSRSGGCGVEIRDQLAEEWLGWYGFCDYAAYEIPPLNGLRDFSGAVLGGGRAWRIVYFVVAYRDAAMIERQHGALDDPRDLFVYHADARADAVFFARLEALAARRANVVVARTGTVVYLTDTTTWLVFRAMRWLAGLRFEFFAPLDGGAYPLVRPDGVYAALAATNASRIGAWTCGAGFPNFSNLANVAKAKTSGFVALDTCRGRARAYTLDVRSCFKRALGPRDLDLPGEAPCDPALFGTAPPGADVATGHARTLGMIRAAFRKSFTGNAAVYSAADVRRLVASPAVLRLHAFFKYGFNAIEEHFFAIALELLDGPVETCDADARAPESTDHVLDDGAGWRRAAVFQTWPYCDAGVRETPQNAVLDLESRCCHGPFCDGTLRENVAGLLERLRRRGVLFARKFDSARSAPLLARIDAWIAADA